MNQDVTPENAVQFLLRDQYVIGAADNDVRADGLAEAASQAFKGLIGGALPEPIELARDLAPLTSDRRLLVWSAHPEEQELLETVGIAGDMPALDGADGWSFSVSNTGGNKIDAFLQRKAGYDATTDPDTGVTTGTMRIELTNTAPAEGLPKYVIGNRIGKPDGTSSLLVTLYSPLGLDQVTVNGAVVGVTAGYRGRLERLPVLRRHPRRRDGDHRGDAVRQGRRPRAGGHVDPADVRRTAAALTAASVNSSHCGRNSADQS